MAYENNTGLPSSTDILRPFVSTEWMTEESRERGTAVHAACHAHLMAGYVMPLKPEWLGYFDSFRRWCDAANPVVIVAEKRFVNEALGYCGQEDFIGTTSQRPGTGLIDWKTSIAVEKWFRLQGASYRDLAKVNGIETYWGGNLRLRADGSMPLMDYWPDNYAMDFSRFVSALSLWNYFNG